MSDYEAPPTAIVIPLKQEGSGAVQGQPPERIEIPIVVPSTQQCHPQKDGEIVVCAADPEAYRLRTDSTPDVAEPAKAEIKLGEGVSAAATVQGANVGGTPSNRAMATVKVSF